MRKEINDEDIEQSGNSAETPPEAGEKEPTAAGGLEQVEELTRERDELKDRLLRKQAEFENFRKRIDRERAEFVQFASAELMREILNVLDSFDLALREAAARSGEDGSEVQQGFELIYKQLLDSLKRFGLEAVEAEGRPFDPHVHEAVSTQPTDTMPEGTVLSELRRGYLLHGKLLRPSMVTVAAPPAATDEGGGDA